MLCLPKSDRQILQFFCHVVWIVLSTQKVAVHCIQQFLKANQARGLRKKYPQGVSGKVYYSFSSLEVNYIIEQVVIMLSYFDNTHL